MRVGEEQTGVMTAMTESGKGDIYPWFARVMGLALIASVLQVMITFAMTKDDFSYFNYWQYFTNQSNVMSALLILYRWSPLYAATPTHIARYESWRAAFVVFMSQTTFVYWALLHGTFVIPDQMTYISSCFLHSGAFIYFLIDYLVAPPETEISLRNALYWFAYPFFYAVFIMVMAQFRSWYPYPFMDPARSGSVRAVVINELVLCAIVIAVVLAVRATHNAWWRRRQNSN